MPDQGNNAAGTDAGKIDVAAITKTVTEQVTAALKSKIDELVNNQKVLADTLAADKKAAQDAATAEAQKAAKSDGESKPEALTADAVQKLVSEAIAADRKAQAEAAAKNGAREALVAKVVKEKLGGNANLGALLAGDDEASLAAAADKLAAEIKTYKPDFGGAAKEGGTPPGGDAKQPLSGNLSPGVAAFANSIKLPA